MPSGVDSLVQPLCPWLRPLVVERLWGPRAPFLCPQQDVDTKTFFELYFRYYDEQCDLLGGHDRGRYTSIKTHTELAQAASLVQQAHHRDEVRKRMSDFLCPQNQETHDNSINLVLRVLLMIKFGNNPHELFGETRIDWNHGCITDFLQSHFSPNHLASQVPPLLKFEKSFKAINIWRIGRIQVLWTDNLEDHLRMTSDDNGVYIFRHVSFLQYHIHNQLFPPGFIEETLKTISLLFPGYDKSTRTWFRRLASHSSIPLDRHVVDLGSLSADKRRVDQFKYWGNRLVDLKGVYDESRPKTLSQWWYDDRNGVQWCMFWITLCALPLAFVFGLVQCAEGVLQVYKAYNP